ncbi:MAG: serine hydroxymethyltransferase [Asgard group archaeon]|nr:serine hydroxymethyltransferase [Asgard group archaeon]
MTRIEEFIQQIYNHCIFRKKAINLIASENCTSPLVRAALASDLTHRYEAEFYGGTKYIRRIMTLTESYLREIFDADYAIISPLSGNLCHLATVEAFSNPKQKIFAVMSDDHGGYPFDYGYFNRKFIPFSFSINQWNINSKKSIQLIKKHRPAVLMFGSSFFLFPHPIKEIAQTFEHRKTLTIAYDGSHVLGLLAGGIFQNPLEEGADLILGSTHKTFPGPQGGIIVTNDLQIYQTLSSLLDLNIDQGIRYIDNNHPQHIAALGIAALEMIEFGEDYAKQVVLNAQVLAEALDSHGVPVKFPEQDYTQSHQLLIEVADWTIGQEIKNRASQFGLFIDSALRLGTSEVTRLGMKELEMKEIAEIFAAIYHEKADAKAERRIRNLAEIFSKPQYCFNSLQEIDWK